jgi:hypothetical protein
VARAVRNPLENMCLRPQQPLHRQIAGGQAAGASATARTLSGPVHKPLETSGQFPGRLLVA